MSWEVKQLPGTIFWEVILKDSHDFNSNYVVMKMPGGAFRLDERDDLTLVSVNDLGDPIQVIVVKNGHVKTVDERGVETGIKLPKDCYDAFVRYIRSLPEISSNDPENALYAAHYFPTRVNRAHAKLIGRSLLPDNVARKMANFSGRPAGNAGEIFEGGRRKQKTRKHRRR